LKVSGSAGSAPTKISRNGNGATLERSMVAPLPWIVMSDATAGSAAGPYQVEYGPGVEYAVLKLYAQLGASSIVSAPALVFAFTTASISALGEQPTAIVAALAWFAELPNSAPAITTTVPARRIRMRPPRSCRSRGHYCSA
jgi:hypothetical protein